MNQNQIVAYITNNLQKDIIIFVVTVTTHGVGVSPVTEFSPGWRIGIQMITF